MFTIFKKEIRSFFGTPGAYIVSSIFVLICALFLWFFDNEYNIFNLGTASLSTFFFIAPWAFLFLIPALTMRQLAEEKQMGTLDWLLTQPIKISNLILGKYLSVLILIAFMLLSTAIFVFSIQYFSMDGKIDTGAIISGYAGLFLLGSLFAATGLAVSSFTENQVIAYVGTVFLCFLMYYGFTGLASYNLLGSLDYYVQQAGAEFHYNSFLKGIIDTRDLLYFVAVSVLFLCLAYFSLIKLLTR
ncbi:MAG: ABC transporter permease subunit [Flavobacteriaceae bacterium]|nr:ABC transporter permease subunit [Flavobacteriaceae bacterium]